jgi:hypothetical protein
MLSFNQKRVVIGIALAFCGLCTINFYIGIGIFSQSAKGLLIVSFVILYLTMYLSGITQKEIEDYRDKKMRDQSSD